MAEVTEAEGAFRNQRGGGVGLCRESEEKQEEG